MTHEGKKTIGTAFVGIVTAWVAYSGFLGADATIGLEAALNATWIGLMAIFMRIGVGKPAALLIVACLFMPVAGCWTVQAFDQKTVDSIDVARKAENEDFVLTVAALKKANAGPVAINSKEIRHQAKLQFFRDWKWAENQKTKVTE